MKGRETAESISSHSQKEALLRITHLGMGSCCKTSLILRILPMLFQLIGWSLHFNLHRDSLFEDVYDKEDCRYNYY